MSIETPTTEEEKISDQSEEIDYKQIAELEAPIKKIIEKIKDGIDNGEYGLIIGDDASGRIPALILGNFVREIYDKKGIEKPNIIFIPGKLENSAREYLDYLEDHLEKWGAKRDKKILITTDTVMWGESLKVLVKMIKELGFKCEIATIGLEAPYMAYINRKLNLGSTKIISGEYENKEAEEFTHTPSIYKSVSRGGWER